VIGRKNRWRSDGGWKDERMEGWMDERMEGRKGS
jgi:hypothetical protein